MSLYFQEIEARVDAARPPELTTQPGLAGAGGPRELTQCPAVQTKGDPYLLE